MAKLIARILFFAAVMLLVAKLVPYDGVIDLLTGLFDLQDAERVTGFILGEPDPDAWYSLHDYFGVLINTLISVPLFSAIMTICRATTNHASFVTHAKECSTSTARRFVKIFGFTFLFWAVLRLVPYESLAHNSEITLTFVAILTVNMAIAIAAYISIMKLVKKIRR